MRTQILFLKDEYTFRFSNFLITGICNFYANCWFKKILYLITPPPVDFLSNHLQTIEVNKPSKQSQVVICYVLGF